MQRLIVSLVVFTLALTACGNGTSDGSYAIADTSCAGPGGQTASLILERAKDAGVQFSFPSSLSDPNIQSMVPNTIQALGLSPNDFCIRDSYVAGAVADAWGAEAEARLGRCDVAKTNVAQALQNLANANQLCGGTTVASNAQCKTLAIWGCSDKL
jgi:hypothetical protein